MHVHWSRRDLLAGIGATSAGLAHAPSAFAQGADRVDAATFGIRPGPDNQSASLKRALAHAADRRLPLFLGPGTYHAGNVPIPDGGMLTGVPGQSRLVPAGPGPILTVTDADGVRLERIALDGTTRSTASDGVLLSGKGARSLTITGCEVRSGGIALESSTGRIVACTVTGARHTAIFARDSAGLAILDNTIRHAGNNGIVIFRSAKGDDGTLIRGNRVEDIRADDGGSGQNGNGINVFRAGGVIVSDNVIPRCAFSAIRANAADGISILGNNGSACEETAIYVEFAFVGAVVANNNIERAAAGISIVNFNKGGRLSACSGNVIRNLNRRRNPQSGVVELGTGIAAEADTAITGNVIDGAAFAGLSIGWGPYLRDVSATGNVVRDSGYGAIVSVAPQAGAAVIRNNLFSGTPKGAIVGFAWAEARTGDLVRGDEARQYPRLSIADNVAI